MIVTPRKFGDEQRYKVTFRGSNDLKPIAKKLSEIALPDNTGLHLCDFDKSTELGKTAAAIANPSPSPSPKVSPSPSPKKH